MNREAEKDWIYDLLKNQEVDGKIYDATYDCYFTLAQAKRSIDIFIELIEFKEDDSIYDKMYKMAVYDHEKMAEISEKVIKQMYSEGIIDDDIYEKAMANLYIASH